MRYACLKDSQGQEEEDRLEDAGGSSSDGYLSVPARALQWLEEPTNLRNFQLCLSAQSVVLAVLYSFWQVSLTTNPWAMPAQYQYTSVPKYKYVPAYL